MTLLLNLLHRLKNKLLKKVKNLQKVQLMLIIQVMKASLKNQQFLLLKLNKRLLMRLVMNNMMTQLKKKKHQQNLNRKLLMKPLLNTQLMPVQMMLFMNSLLSKLLLLLKPQEKLQRKHNKKELILTNQSKFKPSLKIMLKMQLILPLVKLRPLLKLLLKKNHQDSYKELKMDTPKLLQPLTVNKLSMKNSSQTEMDSTKKHSSLSSHLAHQMDKTLKSILISLKTMLMEQDSEKTHAMMVETSLPEND